MGSLGKRIAAMCSVAVLSVTTFSSMFSIEAKADSNSRMQTNIEWAQKKGFNEMDADALSQLSIDDLRMIGVFLSNFYIPFSTTLGESSTTEGEDSVKEQMIDCLVKQCNFAQETAEVLVPMIWNMSLDTAEKLYIGEFFQDAEGNDRVGELPDSIRTALQDSTEEFERQQLVLNASGDFKLDDVVYTYEDDTDEDSDKHPTLTADGNYTKASYYNFLVAWAGGVHADNCDSDAVRGECKARDFCLFWEDGDNKKVVLDSSNRLWLDPSIDENVTNSNSVASIPSASMIVYGMLNDTVNYQAGIGSSIFSVNSFDEYEYLSNDDRETALVTSSQLYVDTFGNILMDFGGSTCVVLPACVNPYAWYNIEDGVTSAGRDINLVNRFMIGELEEGNIVSGGLSADSVSIDGSTDDNWIDYFNERFGTDYSDTTNDQNINTFVFRADAENSLFDLDRFRIWNRGGNGTDNYEIDTAVIDTDATTLIRDVLSDGSVVYDGSWNGLDTDDNMLNFPAWDNNDYLADGIIEIVTGYGIENPWHLAKSISPQVIADFLMIDNVGMLSKITGEDEDTIQSISLFAEADSDNVTTFNSLGLGGNNFSSIGDENKLIMLNGNSFKAYMVSIYLSYVYAYYDDSETPKLSWAFNKEGFPKADGMIDWSDVEIENNALQSETLSLAYYIMHPSEGSNVLVQWFKNKVSAILVGWHEDMVGKAGAASTTGGTKYIGFSGYVTLPSLNDLEWTAYMLDIYDVLVVYFIIIIVIIVLGYKMIGTMTMQQAILSIVLFAVCAYMPPRLINMTVDASNEICNSIYGSKFTYWALVQHEQYAADINAAVSSGSEENYLQSIFASQAKDSASSYATVTVRWQCPKKENTWADVKEELTETTGNDNIFNLTGQMIADVIDGQTFTEEANNMYLYRSYTDVGTYAKSLYENGVLMKSWNKSWNSGDTFFVDHIELGSMGDYWIGIKDFNTYSDEQKSRLDILQDWYYHKLTDYVCQPLMWETVDTTSMTQAVARGFLFDTVYYSTVDCDGNVLDAYDYNRRVLDFCASRSVNFAMLQGLDPMSLASHFIGNNEVVGIPLSSFNTTLSDINSGTVVGANEYNTHDDLSSDKTAIQQDNRIATMVFANYTESPFMFLSYNLRDQLGAATAKTSEDVDVDTVATYKDLFLMKDGAYFYNDVEKSEGYGELRDFMDMRSLFTVVIPYLKMANDIVVDYDNSQGLFLYEDVDLEYDSNNNIVIPAELQEIVGSSSNTLTSVDMTGEYGDYWYKYLHNAEVAQLLNMYTPWVDQMYDCGYAKGENIYVAGEKFYVSNPLDPSTYYEATCRSDGFTITAGREMVFSRSEMAYYGLSMEDLTSVEQKIITMYDNVYAELLQIIDYYNFQPEVLNTAIAMIETFEFNKVFSETSVFGEDHVLYPQNFELKNFSYDAYLRLILAATTGEDLNNLEHGDIYTEVTKNSSILAGIMFILLDLLAVYAIPALKLFFVVAIFLLSILMILVATIRLEVKISKVLGESLVFPLLKFFGISVGMAFIVSLFMYSGNTAVTGRTTRVISLGDPVMVMLVMLVINAAVLYLYFKTCKGVFKDCVKYGKAVGTSIGGMVGGAITFAATALGANKVASSLSSNKHSASRGSRKIAKTVKNAAEGKYDKDNKGGSGGSGGSGGADKSAETPKQDTARQTANPTGKKTSQKGETGENKYNKGKTTKTESKASSGDKKSKATGSKTTDSSAKDKAAKAKDNKSGKSDLNKRMDQKRKNQKRVDARKAQDKKHSHNAQAQAYNRRKQQSQKNKRKMTQQSRRSNRPKKRNGSKRSRAKG